MEKIMSVIKNDDGSYSILENLYPTPAQLNVGDVPMNPNEQMLKNKEETGYTSWYDWRIDKWGCKWPESDLYVSQEYFIKDDGTAQIAFQFESPWGPPIEAFNKISGDFPRILFCLYYEEPGMGFCGKNIWADGDCQESYEAELVQNYFDEDYLFETYIENTISNETIDGDVIVAEIGTPRVTTINTENN